MKYKYDCKDCIYLGSYKEKNTRNEKWGYRLKKYDFYCFVKQ